LLFLEKNLSSPVEIYIKTDTGYGRTGVWHENETLFNSLLEIIKSSKKLKFKGFLTHAGQSYNARGVEEIKHIHFSTIEKLLALKGHFVNDFPDLIISTGDTPTCSVMDDFSGSDEIRPGNFVFYDSTQLAIGSCSLSDVAVAMACPVVAVHESRCEVVIYGGSVHFSKDLAIHETGRSVYGLLVETSETGWGGFIRGASLIKLSQEHGVVQVPPELAGAFRPGDIITIIPAHSCITASQMNRYLTTSGRYVERMFPF
jgi:D-serine deaminase-like pyridoxal phosphate-dependent protein